MTRREVDARETLLFGKYRVEGILGRGRRGTVYLVRHVVLGELRAMKQVPREGGSTLREAEILRRLRHPGIPVLYDVESDSDYHYLLMEYFPGEPLSLRREKGRFSPEEILRYASELGRILLALHTAEPAPILYLDLQPENILIRGGRICLVDFGNAMTPEMSARESRRFGTPGYAAPEQRQGGILDVRTDIYGFGAILWYMCSGRPPGKSGPERAPAGYDARLADLIRDCLLPRQEDRPQSIRKVLERLLAIQGEDPGERKGHFLHAAVCGSRRGIGVTRMCLEISDFAALRGISCILQEKDARGALEKMAQKSGRPDDSGICHAGRYRILPAYGPSVKLPPPECGLLVSDCGDRLEEAARSGADIHFLICGAEAWDGEATAEAVRFMAQCRELRVLFRGAGRGFRPVFADDLTDIACCRLPEGRSLRAEKKRAELLEMLFEGRLPERGGKKTRALSGAGWRNWIWHHLSP